MGQLTAEYQSHSGSVNTSTSPKVQYAYAALSSGSRLTSMTYPSGRVLNYTYASGLDDAVGRLSSISDSSGTLESYAYLGMDLVVKRSHPQSGVDLSYIKTSTEGTADAGDQYIGLDRFNRVVNQKWVNASGTIVDRNTYSYDRDRFCLAVFPIIECSGEPTLWIGFFPVSFDGSPSSPSVKGIKGDITLFDIRSVVR